MVQWRGDADGSDAVNTKEVNEFIHRRAAQYAKQFKLMWTAALGGSAALAEWAGYPARERQGQAEGPSLLTFDDVVGLLKFFHVITPLAPAAVWSQYVLYSCSCKTG